MLTTETGDTETDQKETAVDEIIGIKDGTLARISGLLQDEETAMEAALSSTNVFRETPSDYILQEVNK